MLDEDFFRRLYDSFNRRDIEAALAAMAPDVKWTNGMEGGFVHGREAVREYWTRQFGLIDPRVTPARIETGGDRTVVTVDQFVKDLDGNILADKQVKHVFRRENGLIVSFEIDDDGPAAGN